MHSLTLGKTQREGGKPTESPNTERCKFIDSKSTTGWYPGLSVANSPPTLPILIFCKHSTFWGVGRAHMAWGRGPGGLMWIVGSSHQKQCSRTSYIPSNFRDVVSY